jgi:hypothetical protein
MERTAQLGFGEHRGRHGGRHGAEGRGLVSAGSGCRDGGAFSAQEALPAEDGTALCGFEGHSGLAAALRAGCHGFGFGEPAARRTLPFGLADLAPLGFVLKILVVEEVLFSRSKYEIVSAIHAL